MKATMEVNVLMKTDDPTEIIQAIFDLGAQNIGSYAIKDIRFGKGAKVLGGSLIKLGKRYFLLIGEKDNVAITLEEFDFTSEYVLTSQYPIEVNGLEGGEKARFISREDAVDWLKTLHSADIMKLNVNAPDYQGLAIMYGK